MTAGTRRVPLITLADIADLAGVRRSAVSNWRKRFSDFPPPTAGTAGSPLFDTAHVESWLRRRDRYVGRPGLEHQLWRGVEELRGLAPVETLLGASSAAVVLRYVATQPQRADNLARGAQMQSGFWDIVHRDDPGQRLRELQAVAWELASTTPSLHDIFDPLFDRLPAAAASLLVMLDDAPDDDAARLFETIVGMRRRATGRGGAEWMTSESLTELMIDLAGPLHGMVYDPAAGSGGFLVEAAHAAEGPVRLVGQELNENAWRLANQRLIVHGLDGRIDRANTLQHDAAPELMAATVLLNPPYGMRNWGAERSWNDRRWRFGFPSDTSADMAWLQHAVAHLAPGGRAFVLLPAGSLFREGQDGRIRHELIRQGAVEAIISLPQGLVHRTAMSLALWVVARPGEVAVPDRVLLIDAAAGGRTSLADGAPELIELYHEWRNAGRLKDVGWAAAPPLLDLLGVAATLVPTRWIPSALESTDAAQIVAELEGETRQLARTLAELADSPSVPLGDLATPISKVRRAPIGRLNADGLVGLFRGTRVPQREVTKDGEGLPLLTAAQVREGVEARPGDDLRVAEDVLSRHPELTAPGDVVVLTEGPRVRSLVAREGGAVVAAPLWLVKVQQELIDPSYLAACLESEWNSRHAIGTTVSRTNIRDLEVPLLPLAAQRALARKLRVLEDIRRQCAEADRLARSIRQRLVDGLAAGVVEVGWSTDE